MLHICYKQDDNLLPYCTMMLRDQARVFRNYEELDEEHSSRVPLDWYKRTKCVYAVKNPRRVLKIIKSLELSPNPPSRDTADLPPVLRQLLYINERE